VFLSRDTGKRGELRPVLKTTKEWVLEDAYPS